MNQRIGAALSLIVVGACSVLNAPEALQSGGGNTGATSSNTGGTSTPTAGSKADGGDDTGSGGTATGVGGCGADCPEGGAPPLGRTCDDSAADCGSTAPICDATDGECRPCASDPECLAEVELPYCRTSGANAGRCTECRNSDDCPQAQPVCGASGTCRPCSAHAECEFGACGETGSCATESQVVYALAQTGSTAGTCGTLAEPCRFVATAAGKLTAQRPTLVLLETTAAFDYETASLPAIKGLKVIGNGVTIISSGGASIFRVPANAQVTFDNVVIEGAVDEDEAAIECLNGEVIVVGSTLRDNGMGVFATDCDVTVTESLIEHNANPLEFGQAGINAACVTEGCAKRVLITRNRFIDNGVAIYNYGQQEATIENNLFLRNGSSGYTRVMELRATQTRFAYNTLVENFNSCTYVGIVACIGECASVGNISYNSFPNEPDACYDQVWYNTTPTYSLTEITQPGVTNEIGDPLFVDPTNGDFTPGPGSPAIDGGDPADSPTVDLNGDVRPAGDAPDMGAFEAQ